MKVLLVYPRYPDTFWSFRHAVRVSSKRALFPPLGLLTVGALLPQEWEKKLVDINATPLTDADIQWADYVFISAMVVQRESVKDVIRKCKRLNARMVAGGPLFTSECEEFGEVDHLVLDEAEITLPLFLEDLEKGHPKHLYASQERPDITKTPPPMWRLINMKKYTSMSLQYSRGCPFDCDFCNIGVLNGRNVRTKGKDQFLRELDELYNRGWRSGVFIVDDNFIGNKRKLKGEILPAIIEWQQKRKYPFSLSTQLSINLADDEELMQLLVAAGFDGVFVGIESPNEESLAECNKRQNEHRDLVASVKKLQNHGLQVQAGFILGFDSDPVSVFKSQIKLVQQSGIVMAMVGLLNAPRGTRLYRRMAEENRLTEEKTSGDNTDCSMNFIPRMDRTALISGYKEVLTTLYSPRQYYPRVKMFLTQYKP
ncbi:MAG: B12-binding domain-containing radical SAM protein, partial [Chloroflexi bacterium]|nr:B12-binding domain-containing radical SAM protein [Chloroflexota bacterium]